jgi:hypothetical protein
MKVEALIKKYRTADARWETALKRKGYPADDDAEESAAAGKPHTEAETLRVWWANAWRLALHDAEEKLYAAPEVRNGLVEGLQLREAPTYHEQTVA